MPNILADTCQTNCEEASSQFA